MEMRKKYYALLPSYNHTLKTHSPTLPSHYSRIAAPAKAQKHHCTALHKTKKGSPIPEWNRGVQRSSFYGNKSIRDISLVKSFRQHNKLGRRQCRAAISVGFGQGIVIAVIVVIEVPTILFVVNHKECPTRTLPETSLENDIRRDRELTGQNLFCACNSFLTWHSIPNHIGPAGVMVRGNNGVDQRVNRRKFI